jgi:hypothetical protein
MATSPLQPVESRGIAQTGYDDAAQDYHVQFKAGGPVYVYHEVDADTAAAIASADSVGKAVSTYLVSGGFKWTKLDPPAEDDAGG